jgi:hypothetical protein
VVRAVAFLPLLALAAACSEGTSSTGTPPLDPEIAQRCRRALDDEAACIDCIEASCCVEAVRCGEDLRCKPCIQPGPGTECADPPPEEARDFLECKLEHCADACQPSFVAQDVAPDCEATETPSPTCVTIGDPGVACDPINSDGCPEGEVCAVVAEGFACRPGGTGRGLCQDCGDAAWDRCGPGLHCVSQCARFCCADADCSFFGVCNRPLIADFFHGDPPPGLVGVCEDAR